MKHESIIAGNPLKITFHPTRLHLTQLDIGMQFKSDQTYLECLLEVQQPYTEVALKSLRLNS